MTAPRSGWSRYGCSARATARARSCWSGCSPASRRAQVCACRGAGRRGDRARSRGRRASRRRRARSCPGPAPRLEELLARDLSEVELAVLMIDGIELAGMTHVVALGDHDRRDEDPAVAARRLDGERDRRDRAARRPRRPWPAPRRAAAVRARRRQGALTAVANFEFERLIDRIGGPRRRNRS